MDDAGVSTDLMDPQVQQDWYPTYRYLRDQAPVWVMPGSGQVVLTRFADVQFALRRPDLFPNAEPGQNPLLRTAAAQAVYEERGFKRRSPLSTNPPIHRAYRSTVDSWFNAAGAARARPMIEQVVDRLIDGWVDAGRIELIRDFAEPLPVTVITRMLGLPEVDIPQLKEWSAAWVLPFAGGLTDEQELWVAEQGVAFQHYLLEEVRAKRLRPGDDVLSHLVGVEAPMEDGSRLLTDEEIVTIAEHLYIGGNETTTFALASGVWLMLREPEIHQRLAAEPHLVANFVEEVLRLESPTQGLWRVAAADVELHGTVVKKGSVVHLRYGAANRDDEMFARAGRLDLDRSNSARHLAFSSGEHRCPGAELSRVEQRVAFARLIERLPGLRLDPVANDFHHHPGFVLRALDALHVEWDLPQPRTTERP